MPEVRHVSHALFERDGHSHVMYNAGHSYADIAAISGVTRSEAHRRVQGARMRGWDYLGTGASLDIRTVNYIIENYSGAVSITLMPSGLRRLDISPEMVIHKAKTERNDNVRPRYVTLKKIIEWAEARMQEKIS